MFKNMNQEKHNVFFNGAEYLLIGQESTVMTVEYIGEVLDDVNPQDSSESANVIKGITIAVTGIDMYRSCLNCSAKVTEKNK